MPACGCQLPSYHPYQVVSALYAYLQLLRDRGVPRSVFSEVRQIDEP